VNVDTIDGNNFEIAQPQQMEESDDGEVQYLTDEDVNENEANEEPPKIGITEEPEENEADE
jgi:hypothetical protein